MVFHFELAVFCLLILIHAFVRDFYFCLSKTCGVECVRLSTWNLSLIFFFYRNSGWSGLRYECGLAFPVVSLEIGDFLSLTL